MDSVKADLAARYDEWLKAVQNKDFEALNRIVGDDFTYTASGHGRVTRQQWMDTVPVYDVRAGEVRDLEVQQYGDVAVALTRYWQEAIVGGSPRSGNFLITDVWVRRDGRWQVVTRSSILEG